MGSQREGHDWTTSLSLSRFTESEISTAGAQVSTFLHSYPPQGFPVAQLVKNLPAMGETWVRSLGWEHPLMQRMATYSRILVWRIPWGRRVRRNWLSLSFTHTPRGIIPYSTLWELQVCTLGVPVEASLEAWCLGRQLVQDLGDQPPEKAAVANALVSGDTCWSRVTISKRSTSGTTQMFFLWGPDTKGAAF